MSSVVWWGMAPRIDIETQRADTAQADLAQAQQLIELQAGVLEQQQKTLGDLADLERRLLLQEFNRGGLLQRLFGQVKDRLVSLFSSAPAPAPAGKAKRPAAPTPATPATKPAPEPDPLQERIDQIMEESRREEPAQ